MSFDSPEALLANVILWWIVGAIVGGVGSFAMIPVSAVLQELKLELDQLRKGRKL